MTISPPAKVNPLEVNPGCDDWAKVLVCGIDTLSLAIDVRWQNEEFFEYLEAIKQIAAQYNKPLTVFLDLYDPPNESPFRIYNHGTQGYRWLISNAQYALQIGNWTRPKKKGRPSVLATVRSETLWALGINGSVRQLQELLLKAGAAISKIKVSRVDPCVDILLPEIAWQGNLVDHRVTRSRYFAQYYSNNILTGIAIGKGKLSARLYDKPLEILQQSPEKQWFYKIWDIAPGNIPEGCRIIRVEFQIRREALKELGIDSFADLIQKAPQLWAYCTHKWLKFRSRPGEHHTMRKTFQWWESVQNGFEGAQNAMPLIRTAAFQAQEKRLFAQAMGLLTSLHALDCEFKGRRVDRPSSIHDVFASFKQQYLMSNLNDELINDEVFHKRARYHRFINANHQF